jgi:haloalkane dehalogenase
MAMLFGHWDRWEPRPPEHEINRDILDFLIWISENSDSIETEPLERLATHRDNAAYLNWREGAVLRTPEERFANLPDYPYEPEFAEIEGLRMAYVIHGSGDPILMLHGEPTWGFLYRRMIPILSGAGQTIVPDLIGFGRSDKPVLPNAYSYRSHVRWMRKFIEAVDLQHITLICQDWGGLIGLRVLSQIPQRFRSAIIMNTGIPTGGEPGDAFNAWRMYSQRIAEFDIPSLMAQAVRRKLTDGEIGAYGAPFPTRAYQTGALLFPRLVPNRPDHPGAYDNRMAVEILKTLDMPVYLIFGENDAVTGPMEAVLKTIFKNIRDILRVPEAGHFIQEDAGERVGEKIKNWMLKQ